MDVACYQWFVWVVTKGFAGSSFCGIYGATTKAGKIGVKSGRLLAVCYPVLLPVRHAAPS